MWELGFTREYCTWLLAPVLGRCGVSTIRLTMPNLEAYECVRRAETIGRPLVAAAFPRTRFRVKRSQPPPSARPQAEGEAWSGSWLFEEQPMLVEAGFDAAFEMSGGDADDFPAQHPPFPERGPADPDRLGSPSADAFLCRSFRQSGRPRRSPAGLVTFSDRFVIQDLGQPGPNTTRSEDDADR